MVLLYVFLKNSLPRKSSSTKLTVMLPVGKVHPVADCVVLYVHLQNKKMQKISNIATLKYFCGDGLEGKLNIARVHKCPGSGSGWSLSVVGWSGW